MTPAAVSDSALHATRPGPEGEATLGGSSVAELVRAGGRERRTANVVVVTAGLVAVGAAVGAMVGVLVLATWLIPKGRLLELLLDLEGILYGGTFGAVMGVVLGPASAWLLMRHVPLRKAVGGTALGTLAGSLPGLLGDPLLGFMGALLGFGAAAFLLWLEDAWKTRNDPLDGGELPRE